MHWKWSKLQWGFLKEYPNPWPEWMFSPIMLSRIVHSENGSAWLADMCLNFKVRGRDETALPFTASLHSFFSPPVCCQSSGFIRETETCVSTNAEAVNNVEKSQCSGVVVDSISVWLSHTSTTSKWQVYTHFYSLPWTGDLSRVYPALSWWFWDRLQTCLQKW